jgi:uncharacterized protein
MNTKEAMMSHRKRRMRVYSQDTLFAVARLDPGAAIPDWASSFFSITRTSDELSIVCAESSVPAGIVAERGFRMLMVEGPLDFSLTGVMASIAGPLADAGVSMFAVSTYDTDYVLVRDFAGAVAALGGAGWDVAVGDSK